MLRRFPEGIGIGGPAVCGAYWRGHSVRVLATDVENTQVNPLSRVKFELATYLWNWRTPHARNCWSINRDILAFIVSARGFEKFNWLE